MAVPQLVLDAIRFLLALAAPAALGALVLAGIALRREGTTSFSVGGGGFSKWMFWAIVMITLPQCIRVVRFLGRRSAASRRWHWQWLDVRVRE